MPGLADVIGIFLFKQYIQTLPSELEEAARIDGAQRVARVRADHPAAVRSGAGGDRHLSRFSATGTPSCGR